MKFRRPPGAGVLAWLIATALGVAVAWVGLRPVLAVAVPDRAAPLSAADVRHMALPSIVTVPAPALPDATPSGTPTPTASSTPPGSAEPNGSPTRTATGPASSAATVVDGWTVTTLPDGTPSYLRSFQVRGGSTVIRMTPGQVSLVSATPAPDYSVAPSQSEPTRLVVQFVATGRYDIVDAMWWNDHPYAQVSSVG